MDNHALYTTRILLEGKEQHICLLHMKQTKVGCHSWVQDQTNWDI